MTINEVVKKIKDIADNHNQINTFGYGKLPEVGKSAPVLYPLFHIIQRGSSKNGSALVLKFTALFADLVHKDLSNEQEVISDQLQTATDVLAQLADSDYNWEFEAKSELQNFYDRFDDDVTGWTMDFEITTADPANRCAIPYINVPEILNDEDYVSVIQNSDASYLVNLSVGVDLTLPDEVLNVYVNGVLNQTGVYIPISGQVINIS